MLLCCLLQRDLWVWKSVLPPPLGSEVNPAPSGLMVQGCSEDGALHLVTVAGWPPKLVVIAALALQRAVSVVSLPPGAGLQPTYNPTDTFNMRSFTRSDCWGEPFENWGPVNTASIF